MYSYTLDSQCKNVDKNEHNNDCLRAALRVGGRRGGMWQRTLNFFFKGRWLGPKINFFKVRSNSGAIGSLVEEQKRRSARDWCGKDP